MTRLDILKKIDDILNVCSENLCGEKCEHSADLLELGLALEEMTRRKRFAQTNTEEKEYVKQIDTPKEIKIRRIKGLIEKGYSQPEIIKELGVFDSSYYRFCKDNNIVNPNPLKRVYTCNGLTIEQIKELYEKGMTTIEIADKYDLNIKVFRKFQYTHKIVNPNKAKTRRKRNG